MTEAPEKLWMTAEEQGWPGSFRSFRLSDLEHPEEYPAYVRADLFTALQSENDHLTRERDNAAQHRPLRGWWLETENRRLMIELEQVKRDLAATQEKLIEANNSVIQRNAERLAGERVVTDAMIEAGLEYYAEGGCGGLADHERREVVEAIIEAALAGAKP